MAKEQRFVFRSTLAGGTGWPSSNLALLDLNDADTCTTVILGTVNDATLRTNADGKNYICNLGTIRTNVTAAQAGYPTNSRAAMLGGVATSNSGFRFEYYDSPGVYNVKIATGAASGTSLSPIAIFDGDYITVNNRYVGVSKTHWTPGMNVLVSSGIVSIVDGTCWRGSTAYQPATPGVAGTDCPSGSTTPYTDNNGTVWNRMNRADGTPLVAAGYIYGTSTGPTVVGEMGSTLVSVDAWGTVDTQVTISGEYGNAISLHRYGGLAYLRTFSVKLNPLFALVDVSLRDRVNRNVGVAPTLYTKEVNGLRALKIVATSGVPAYTLSGDLAAYFDVVEDNGDYWLEHASPMADVLAGSRSLIITQTDAASSNVTHQTVLTCNVVSSDGKPTTGLYSVCTTLAWLRDKAVQDVHDTIWPGAVGTADVTTTVNTMAEFIAAYNGAPANTKTHILVAGTAYNGWMDPDNRDLGTGWILISPAPGHDPEMATLFHGAARHVEWRDLKFINDPARTTDYYSFRFYSPGVAGIGGVAGRFTEVKFNNCRIGMGFVAGFDPQTYTEANIDNRFILAEHGYSLEMVDCSFYGNEQTVFVSNYYMARFERCDNRWSTQDFLQLSPAGTSYNGLKGTFPDDNMYVALIDCTIRDEPDFVGFVTGDHTDWGQILRSGNTKVRWAAGGTAGINGSLVLYNDVVPVRVYRIASGGGGVYGATAPTATAISADQVNGAVTLTYLGFIPACDIHVLIRGGSQNADGPLRGLSARQSFIDSNASRGQNTYLTVLNVASANASQIGWHLGTGESIIERCSMVGPAHMSAASQIAFRPLDPTCYADGAGYVMVRNTIMGQASAASALGGMSVDSTNVLQSFRSDAATDPNTVMEGPFTQLGSGELAGQWHFPTLDDTGTNSRAAFDTDLRSFLAPVLGVDAGIYVSGDAPPTDPTSYTLAIDAATTVTYPVNVTATVVLNEVATSEVNITIATNLLGTFAAGNPVITIAIGQTTGTKVWTPSAPSSGTFSASDDSGLFDPPTIPHTQAPDPDPTAYTLGVDIAPFAVFPAQATLTATLDAVATSEVQITLSSTLAGTFTGGAVITIAIGQSSGTKIFTPSAAGEASFSATDNAGLADPSPVVVTYEVPAAPSPTSYTLSLDRTSVPMGSPVTLTVIVDEAAVDPIDFTVTPSLPGALTGELSVGVGETGDAIIWTPSQVGSAVLAVGNGIGLTGDASIGVTVTHPPPLVAGRMKGAGLKRHFR